MNGKTVLSFIVGAVAGAATSWFYAKKYFQEIADEEIAAVKTEYKKTHDEHYRATQEEIANSLRAREYSPEKIADILNIEDVGKIREWLGEPKTEDKEVVEKIERPAYNKVNKAPNGPRIISLDEFGKQTLAVTWTYYSDGVVTDEMDNVVEDVDDALGKGFEDAFDETGVIYITNPVRRCDYELLYEEEPYWVLHHSED